MPATAASTPVTTTAPPSGARSVAIDRIRGWAMLLMLVDHVCLFVGGLDLIRLSAGRVAMPLFFLLAGHLFTRLRWRHAAILVAGLAVPLVVPNIDSPNVLVLYVLGCVLLTVVRRFNVPLIVLPLVALTAAANHWVITPPTGFDFLPVFALMCVGAMTRREWFEGWGSRLPGWPERLGRFPVTFYLGHLLVLCVIAAALS